ncbi:MAG: hypothetical protein K8T90_15220 [Planctomycetes bacterium]|nr:hypothetical protein [Planctomycetota bacterium]
MSNDKTPPKQPSEGTGTRTPFGRVYASTKERGTLKLGSRKPSVVKTPVETPTQEKTPPTRPTSKPPVPTPQKQGTPKEPTSTSTPTPVRQDTGLETARARLEKERSRLDRKLAEAVGTTGMDAPVLAKSLSDLEIALADATSTDELEPCRKKLETLTESVEDFVRTAPAAGKARTAFNDALDRAEAARDEAQSLPGHDVCKAVSAPAEAIDACIGRAIVHASAATAKAWTEAIDLLMDPAAELERARQASGVAKAAGDAMRAADLAVQDLSKFRFIDLAPATGPLGIGRTEFSNATTTEQINGARVKFETALNAANSAKSRAEVTIQAWGAADRALRQAERAILSCQGTVGYGPLVAQATEILSGVNTTRRALDAGDSHGKVWEAAVAAQELADRADEARKLAPKAAETLIALSKARAKVTKVEKLGYVDTSAAAKVVSDAELAVSEARDGDAVGRAMEPLGTIDDLLTRAQKAAGPAGKEREVYLKARREAVERITSVLSMPGAVSGQGVLADERMVRVIAQMEKILGASDTQARGCTVESFKEARRLLSPFEKFAELAQGFADETKKAMKEDFAAQRDYDREMLRLEQAALRLEELPGQESARVALGVLRKAARDSLKQVGGLTRGFAAAVKLLTDKTTGHAAILAKAKQDEEERTKGAQYDDEVLGMHRAVLTLAIKTGETDELVPDTVYRGWRAELRNALESALLTKGLTTEQAAKNRKAALERIAAVRSSVDDEARVAKPLVSDVRKRLDVIESKFVAPLAGLASDGYLESVRGEIARIRDVEVASRAWRAASDRLDTIELQLADRADVLTKSKDEWTKLETELEQRLTDGKPIVEGWPERSGGLVSLRPEMRTLIDGTKQTRDWQTSVGRGTTLLKEYDERMVAIRKVLGDQDPKAIGIAAGKVRAQATELIAGAEQAVQKFADEHLVGIRNVGAVAPVKAVQLLIARWKKFVADPKVPEGSTPDETFEAELKKLQRDLDLATRALDVAARSVSGRARLQREGFDADVLEDDQARPKVVRSKLSLLESRGGDVSAFRNVLDVENPDFKAIEKLVDAQIERITKSLEQRASKGRERTGGLAKKVRNEQGSKETFKAYYQTVVEQTEDLQAMFESGDPDLIRQAEEETAALEQKFAEAVKPPKDGPTFAKVEDAWSKIAQSLGGNVLERMPDTWRRLSDRSEAECAKSKTMAPADALVFLEPLIVDCARAQVEADKVAERYVQFGETAERVKKTLESLVGSTATTLSFGKVDVGAFEKRVATRVESAKETAKTEGGLDAAFLALASILEELEAIRTSPDPREALGRVNAEAKREQDAVISYCRQYEGLRQDFKQFRDQARWVMATKGGDESLLTELERTLEVADKLVAPYMDLRSRVPHKKKLANASPPMDRVVQSFTAASERVKNGITAARRIIRNPNGTTVDVSGDLDGAEAAWRSAAAAFGKHVKSLADRIETSVKEDGTNGPKVADGVKALLPRLRGLSTKFPPQAFTASVAALVQAKKSDKAKAAREVVLRDVRRNAAAITKDPLVQALAKKPNPFGVNLQIITSELRAALKTVEREALFTS